MSSRVERGAASSGRVSIPSSVMKTIEDIKEITGKNHSEDEIHAMLKECSMDPNETTQKLLLLDTFHEVKKKRDRRKEIITKEAAESKWKPNTQVRANRDRGNYALHVSHDAGGGRSLGRSNENATGPLSEKGTRKVPLSTSQEMKRDGTSSSNVPAKVAHGDVTKSNALVMRDIQKHQLLDSSNSATSISSAPASGSYFFSSDPLLLPSQDSPLHNPVGTIRHEVRELIADSSAERKQDAPRIISPVSRISNSQLKMPKEQIQHLECKLPVSSTIGVSAVSRPSSNHSNRSQVIDLQKVGAGKEWKPKSTNSSVGQGATVASSSEASTVSVDSHPILQPTLKEDTSELQRTLEESHISVGQHVIIPDHLHVPEAEKLGFFFGSFDASFGLDVNDKTPSLSELEAIDESAKGIQLSYEKASVDAEDTEVKHLDQLQSPTHGPKSSVISEVEVSPTNAIDGSNQQIASGTNQHHVVHTCANNNFGFMPPIVNGQLTASESSESQVHDAPRQPGFVVQQPFDPASYYAQFYHSGMDNDGRLSPFHSGAAASKYNGNAAIFSPQTSQSPQEWQSCGPPVLSTASPMPLMQSSINAQHTLPIFRQPTGVHLPHYPPNYFPYGPYFSPFYAPPPAMHQFLSNGAFPQQPQAGNLYPTPPPGTTAKYTIPQQKQQGSNTPNLTHIGVPGSYPPYGLSMPNYMSTSATAVTLTSNEDHHATPKGKENNICNEGLGGVWFATPNQDISAALQASTSMYNHYPQTGQLAFAPTRPTFPGIFHPAAQATTLHPLLQHSQQPITTSADVAVGPNPSVCQQQPHHQNWPNNY